MGKGAGKRLKWLTLSPLASSELPSDIQFTTKKPFFTASVVLSVRLQSDAHSAGGARMVAEASVQAKVPVFGNIQYSIEVISGPLAVKSELFAFESVFERDDAKDTYRKIVAHGNMLRLETPVPGQEPVSKMREIAITPPAPLLAHLLVLPALQASREPGTDIYVAQLVNGLKMQALRLDRLSQSETKESYRGRVISTPSELTEEEFRDLSWEHAMNFEFDFDLQRNTVSATHLQLPVIGKIEIK